MFFQDVQRSWETERVPELNSASWAVLPVPWAPFGPSCLPPGRPLGRPTCLLGSLLAVLLATWEPFGSSTLAAGRLRPPKLQF